MRKTFEELEDIKRQKGVNRLYSWSRISCYMTSPYEYFLKYVEPKKEDRTDCVYAPIGGICHSIIENFYSGKIQYNDMISEFEDGWLTTIDIADLKFDRNDTAKNKSIAAKYKIDLEHFFSNHIPIDNKVILEQFITIDIDGAVLQGYIDALHRNPETDCFHVIDWKTSTRYSKATIAEKSGQLVIYGIGLHQMGVPYERIKPCFNFLKYVAVECQQANGKWKTREIERREIGNKLQSNVKMWLKKLGYEENLMKYLDKLAQTNDLKCLPKEVQDKFKVHDCYVFVDFNEEIAEEWIKKISATIKEIEQKERQYKETLDETIFYDDPERVKKESYYFATLCGYSANLHKPYKHYLEELEAKEKGDNLFSGVGTDTGDVKMSNDDMSWLDEL